MPVVRLERGNIASPEVVAHPDTPSIAAARLPLIDGVTDVAAARHARQNPCNAHARGRGGLH